MIKVRHFRLYSIACLFMAIIIFSFIKNTAEASTVTQASDFYFTFNGKTGANGAEFDLTSPNAMLNVTTKNLADPYTVDWILSEPGVISLGNNKTNNSDFVNVTRNGPGYSAITAIIHQGTMTFSINCQIKVDLEFDYQAMGVTVATTTKEKIVVINSFADTKQIKLKYVDYTPDGDVVPVSGAAISYSAVSMDSDNKGVVTVDKNGKLTPVGAGSAFITVTTNTLSTQDKALSITIRVVVKPTFSLSYTDILGNDQTVNSVDDVKLVNPANNVPSNFDITSNATLASNLKWEVYDTSTGKKISAGDTSKMTYTVSPISGNVSFSNVKAGTYEIYAFVDNSYNVNTNAPYAYMKVIVPINISDTNLVMTVGDTYNIMENSNIPEADIFEYYYDQGNVNIANIDKTSSVITAKMKGTVRLRLVYNPAFKLFDNASPIPDIYINITVIDGIALSTTNATLYTKGTLQLSAIVSDRTQPITWTSSDSSIATVKDGLVTAIKTGKVTITATQKINGVVKKATCDITVQQSVATIVIDPAQTVISINGYLTIHATITPKDLSGVKLKWQSSNENIVKIVEANDLTATIQGVAGGHAVIAAINQDNVVVGYCDVTVQQSVTSISLNETNVTLGSSTKQFQLRAIVGPDNAVNKNVLWSSTDTSKAKVDANGMVTLLKPGVVAIIATSQDNPSVTAICNITIQIPIASIALDETQKTMYVGQTARLTYVVMPTNASNNAVTWTSTNSKVATVDTTGKVTAKSVGTTVIILKAVDGGSSVYCTITVKQVATGVKFDVTDLKLKVGQYYHINVTTTPKDSTENSLVWESSDTKVVTVDANGKLVAKDSGTAVIIARTDSGAVAYCKVTVTKSVDGLILNFSDKTIYAGDSFKLKVSVSPSTASDLSVTWKSSNIKVATVSKKGDVEGLIGGTAIITATTEDGGYSASCVVTVEEFVTSVKLNHGSYTVGLGDTATLKATVTTKTASNKKVHWKSSNTRVATVNQNGKITGISLGYATITATALDGSDADASCKVRVVIPVSSVSLNKSYVSLLVGQSKSLKATVSPKKSSYRKVKWTSSDNSVAMVDGDGVITALKAGDAKITASASDSSGKKSIAYVLVRDRVPATGITVSDKKIIMISGEEKIIQAVLSPATSTDGFTWSTDNSGIAKVDKTSGKITAKATGTAVITVMSDSGQTAVIEVTVIGLNVTHLTLEQYTDYTLYVEGATTSIKWDVSNPEIATVTNGRVSSRAVGTTTVTATVNGRRLSCKLKVVKIK